MVDDVIAISGPCKSQIFNLQKIRAVIHQTTPNTLLSSFLALFYNSHISNWSYSFNSKFQDIWKIHWKYLITSSSRDRSSPEKSLFFQDTRDHQEHDAKNHLSIPGPSPENLMAEVLSLKRKPT